MDKLEEINLDEITAYRHKYPLAVGQDTPYGYEYEYPKGNVVGRVYFTVHEQAYKIIMPGYIFNDKTVTQELAFQYIERKIQKHAEHIESEYDKGVVYEAL